MRAVVRSAIIGDAQLQALGVTSAGVLSGDIDTPEPRPFLNLKWGTRLPAPYGGVAYRNTLAVWVHDEPNDYGRIESILARLRVVLVGIQGVPDTNDYVSQVQWNGDGPDLKDDGHRTITRVGNFTINGSE
jgi:hypothetical protein